MGATAPATNDQPSKTTASCPQGLQEDGISLYVHVPFCVSKCNYCDFNSWATRNVDYAAFVDALLEEARLQTEGLMPQTVFIGGGTPSILPPQELARLLDELNILCGFKDSAVEVSMEANPESFLPDVAAVAAEGGVNRISIGVQSLREDVLAAYDRAHSPQQALDAIDTAKDAGFARVNADLIYAFPGQQPEQWIEDLQQVAGSGVNHLSCYELSFEPGTALTKKHLAGRFDRSDPELCAELFESTRQTCSELGFARYEVSNFARRGEECLHNLVYWRSLNWVGIGPGAASWVGQRRSINIADPVAWADQVANKDGRSKAEECDPETVLFDCFMMGLRLEHEGLDFDRAMRISGIDPRDHYQQQLAELQEDGLLEVNEFRARATADGFRLLDGVLQRLLPRRQV